MDKEWIIFVPFRNLKFILSVICTIYVKNNFIRLFAFEFSEIICSNFAGACIYKLLSQKIILGIERHVDTAQLNRRPQIFK
jgi:hypothetical protein